MSPYSMESDPLWTDGPMSSFILSISTPVLAQSSACNSFNNLAFDCRGIESPWLLRLLSVWCSWHVWWISLSTFRFLLLRRVILSEQGCAIGCSWVSVHWLYAWALAINALAGRVCCGHLKGPCAVQTKERQKPLQTETNSSRVLVAGFSLGSKIWQVMIHWYMIHLHSFPQELLHW